MTGDEAWELAQHAARVVATVRDHDPADTAALIASTPGALADLVVVLAAMVDPGRPVVELLSWVRDCDPQRPGAVELSEVHRLVVAGVNPQAARVLAGVA